MWALQILLCRKYFLAHTARNEYATDFLHFSPRKSYNNREQDWAEDRNYKAGYQFTMKILNNIMISEITDKLIFYRNSVNFVSKCSSGYADLFDTEQAIIKLYYFNQESWKINLPKIFKTRKFDFNAIVFSWREASKFYT